jgi:fructose-1,6-bisphosphatase/sedoheptulose 1,7-bisphosphatase-like protein
MQGRMAPQSASESARVEANEQADLRYTLADLVRGQDSLLVACGVTDSTLLPGARRSAGGVEVSGLLATPRLGLIRMSMRVDAATTPGSGA